VNVLWAERAAAIGARTVPASEGAPLLAALWAGGRITPLPEATLLRVAERFAYADLPVAARPIEQDEDGDFMLVLLEGALTVERHAVHGRPVRVAEVRPGDTCGEMALLDHGPRFSAVVARRASRVAVLELAVLQRVMAEDPETALVLAVALARRLSLRLRSVGTRLAALLSEEEVA
jgi:CRP-like cAMP-binding protein